MTIKESSLRSSKAEIIEGVILGASDNLNSNPRRFPCVKMIKSIGADFHGNVIFFLLGRQSVVFQKLFANFCFSSAFIAIHHI
jgi:hypothetical protein